MTIPTTPPCGQGLRCQSPDDCDHVFATPDRTTARLHPDDWFVDPNAPELAGDEAGQEAARALEARVMWACKLDCPIRTQCLALGMQPGPTLQHGVYGGHSAAQRREITREVARRKAAEAEAGRLTE